MMSFYSTTGLETSSPFVTLRKTLVTNRAGFRGGAGAPGPRPSSNRGASHQTPQGEGKGKGGWEGLPPF